MNMDPGTGQPVSARFTVRLKVMEEESVTNKLGEMAYRAGHSLSDEVRQALRYWIDQWDETNS